MNLHSHLVSENRFYYFVIEKGSVKNFPNNDLCKKYRIDVVFQTKCMQTTNSIQLQKLTLQ